VSKYKYGFEADGKSFDARLPAFVIKKSFEILQSC
jgi:hypothetical protein